MGKSNSEVKMDIEKRVSNYMSEYPDAIADVEKAREMAEAGNEAETMAVQALKKASMLRRESDGHEQQSEATQKHADRLYRWGDKKEAETQERFAFHDRSLANNNRREAERIEKEAETYRNIADKLEDDAGKSYDERNDAEERRLKAERDLFPEYMWSENKEKYKQACEEMDPEVSRRISRVKSDLINLIGSNSKELQAIFDIIDNNTLHGDYKEAYIEKYTGFLKGIDKKKEAQ